ncbi:DNA gyrase inhibitor YacG [Rubrivivax sp. A210]|uniref:DNA gyrase inhibitor YacG n=1 Tax=Rubrivivax sp. A210 TaxID=2772301 RepID=UPI001919706E|nr:DNA gyrase inhibitor YacG [Rubrivivax sp. A210]CAD5374140.1 DNA gyrase inhibitor YacG [Rubrivivax sp. A210]
MNDDALRLVPCPGCGQPAPYAPSNAWRPFCSERCRSADLGAWASERFRLPLATPSDDDGAVPEA